MFDMVLSGGTVLDPGEGISESIDVGITRGRISRIGSSLGDPTGQLIDCRGRLVVPGLLDGHTHIFHRVSRVGAPPDEAHLRRGVTAVADAGTVGASTFEAFKHDVVTTSEMRIVCFLNVSILGLIDFRYSELSDPLTLSTSDAIATAASHPDVVRGFKIRLSNDVVGRKCLEYLRMAAQIAREAALPLMVHIGDTAEPLPTILDELSSGDVVSHCYTGKAEGILGDQGILREVLDARNRGILFDSAHGRSNMSFRVAKAAIDQGFMPDMISSDTSRRNWQGPVFDLVTTMSKMLALGMSIDDVVLRTTKRPAVVLGLASEGYGRLRIGDSANITVLERVGPSRLIDADGEEMTAPRLEPVAAIVGGKRVTLVPWRGNAPDLSLAT